MKKSKKPIWEKPKQKGKKSTKLTPEQIQEAKERALKAGRKYPNLVDNMWVAKNSKLQKYEDINN
jgi:hypothetical protein